MKKIAIMTLVLLTGAVTHVQADSKTTPIKVGKLFKDCEACPEMVALPAGSFLIGSPKEEIGRQHDEGPQRQITFKKPFAIGIYTVTAAEWDIFIKETNTPRRSGDTRPGRACTEGKPSYAYGPRQPAVCMNYEDVVAYTQWLSKKTGKSYRLPSEAEREYAARAGSTGAFPFPFDKEGVYKINQHANTYGSDDGYEHTAPVGSFPPNAFGLFEMHGNVYERVADCFNEDYEKIPTDGTAWIEKDCEVYMMRGNDWIEPPIFSRSANRNGIDEEAIGDWLGVRVVRDL